MNTGTRMHYSRARACGKIAPVIMVTILSAISMIGCQTSAGQVIVARPATADTSVSSEANKNWPATVNVPSGTLLFVSLNTTLRTDREMSGDGVVARLYQPVRVNHMTVFPAGSTIRGRLLLVAEPYTTSGKARLSVQFDRIVDASGRIHPISTSPIVFVGECDRTPDERDKPAGSVRATFVSGKRLVNDALVGDEAHSEGGTIAFATESKQIELPSNQHFVVKLKSALHVSVAKLTASM